MAPRWTRAATSTTVRRCPAGPTIRRIASDASAGGYKFGDIVLGVVSSDAFRARRVPVAAAAGEEGTKTNATKSDAAKTSSTGGTSGTKSDAPKNTATNRQP